jgi:cell wall-associated NlpC family hydrolase
MEPHAGDPRLLRIVRIVIALSAVFSAACASTSSVARPAPFPGATPPPVTVSGVPRAPAPAASPRALAGVIETALRLQGTRYRLGGATPQAGFDCSGFVRYVFEQHEIEVPRTVAEQYAAGERVDRDQVQRGDLLFFSTTAPGPTHVGIALGGDQPGRFVHAPGSGGSVRVERFDTPYWRSRLLSIRRVR